MRAFFAAIFLGVLVSAAQALTYDEKLAACLACHGEQGISETPEVPSLAGMPPDFTLIQLFLFRQGTRKVEIMNDLAKDMTDDDLRKFSDYFAKLPPPKASGEAPNAEVAARAQEFRVGVAHVEAGDRAALEVPQHGPAGQRVIGVPPHGAQCIGAPSPSGPSAPSGRRRRAA